MKEKQKKSVRDERNKSVDSLFANTEIHGTLTLITLYLTRVRLLSWTISLLIVFVSIY